MTVLCCPVCKTLQRSKCLKYMLVAQQVPATMKVILMKAHALTENAHIGLLVVLVLVIVMILKCIELLTFIVSVVILFFLCVANAMSLESINAIKDTCVTSQIMKERSLVVDINQLRVTVSCQYLNVILL